MAVNHIHALLLELERGALARSDKATAAQYRQRIGINRAANQVRRRAGQTSSLPHPRQLHLIDASERSA